MANRLTKLVATIVFVAGMSSLATVASATPVANGLAIKNAVPASVEIVQWRRGWGGGGWGYRRGWGWGGVGAGFVAGAVIGGALASPYYGYDPLLPGSLRGASGPGRVRRAGSRLCCSRRSRCRRCSCVLHAAVQILRSQKRDISRLRWRSPSLSLSSS